ncbi:MULTISPECIES: zinc-binding dehydrogenase [unclassified Mesorhizobium]|uniref:zinc-binding dehydrogenase n=1 Tax=unclassified Mesorhizobium TaxID=325217 RepID=UPI000FD9626D|nr:MULTISPECIES: zinc-binding dehydrogenase [unclassified Mesorhizobium]TGQ04794.1 alcohol dehydrogenase [Mesorhizobium sp. M2E.F.Ca.ET.219.01.1.1]TGT65496.1 alcohol dehydrogenase [Mesorhizobium sp. M2E.F.Ca.ET.166.01.1.1]TGV97542.1 alcohol dehydrogenase [Mesorhizobium sp. M2E.F.Ca.ET.154.01.1.1]
MLAYEATSAGLRLSERTRPSPGPGEVAIDVGAIALNRGESRRAIRGGFPEGFVPGWDTAGVISQVGSGARGLPLGTRVVARALSGGWAQCRIADCRDVAVVPADVDLGRAATLGTAATTALAVLTRGGPLLGRTVLITGASGSVGQFAIQLARLGGARVSAVTRAEGDRELLVSLGAHDVFTDLGSVKGADLVIETLGGPSLVQAAGLLNAGGSLQSLGWSAGQDAVFADFDHLMKTGGTIQGFAIGKRHVGMLLTQLLGLLQRGALKTCIQTRQPWETLPAAAAAVLQSGFRGKAVLDVTGFAHAAPWPLP